VGQGAAVKGEEKLAQNMIFLHNYRLTVALLIFR
jgi:hypothetical protein